MGHDSKIRQITQADQQKAAADERARIAALGPQVRDRFNRPITEGSFVLFMPGLPVLYRIDRLTVSLDPNIPPGTIEIKMTARVPLYVQHETPVEQLVFIAAPPTREELAAAEQAKAKDEEQPAPQASGPRLVLTDTDKAPDTPAPTAATPEESIDGQSEK